MRPATAALQSYLAANLSVVMEDLYTFVLAGGTVLRFGSGTLPRTIPAANFPGSPFNYAASGNQVFAVGPRFGRSTITVKIGVEPTELDIAIDAGPGDVTVGSLTWQEALATGLFDGATVELDRFFMPQGGDGSAGPLNTNLGAVVWFYGRVADVDSGRSMLAIKVKNLLNLLAQQQMPRRLFQSACSHVFGDAMCGYNRVAGTNALGAATGLGQIDIAADAGSATNGVVVAGGFSPSPAGSYTQGTIIGATGANTGITRTINAVAINTVYPRTPFPAVPAIGDTFLVLPGCDHTPPTCNATFNNLGRFGGMPYIPPPELAV